jgi:hypothetical protein
MFHRQSSFSLLFISVISLAGVVACGGDATDPNLKLSKLAGVSFNGEKTGDPCKALKSEEFFLALLGNYNAAAKDKYKYVQGAQASSDGTFIDGKSYDIVIFSEGIALDTELGIKIFNFNHDENKPELGADDFRLLSADVEGASGHSAGAKMDHTAVSGLVAEVVIDRLCYANDNTLQVTFYADYLDPGFPYDGGTWEFKLAENSSSGSNPSGGGSAGGEY